MLAKGIAPPPGFSRPEVAKIPMEDHRTIGIGATGTPETVRRPGVRSLRTSLRVDRAKRETSR